MNLEVHCSALPMYADCGRRQAAKMFRPLIQQQGYEFRTEPQGIGAAVGTAMHDAIGYTLQAKIDTGDLGNQTEAEQRGLQSLEDRVRQGLSWDQTTPNLNTAQKQVVRQSRAYRLMTAPNIEPVAVEYQIRAQRDSGLVVSGRLDLMVDNGLRDAKSGRVRRVNAAQYGGYALLREAKGLPTGEIHEDYVARVSIRDPQPDPVDISLDIEVCKSAALAVLSRIEFDLAHFKATGRREAFMANTNSMLCSAKFCEAFGTDWCPESRMKE